jgi:endonuclease YncB( thermonuclease family)
MSTFIRSIAAFVVLSTSPGSADEFYSGRVTKVADGETFTINDDGQKVRVRFCGIDSPERGQPGYG